MAEGYAVKNRSAPPCAVIPVVAYSDVAAAVAWLEAAFGFRVRLRIGSHRAQMWFGSACLVVGEEGKDRQWATRSSVMLRVPDVDALCTRAVAHGARLVHAPQTHVYGERQATLEDFAGHIWTLTQTVEDVEPAAWGGEAVEL
ncbi:MAG: VOC family protein [Acidobacteriaceae bacterium]